MVLGQVFLKERPFHAQDRDGLLKGGGLGARLYKKLKMPFKMR